MYSVLELSSKRNDIVLICPPLEINDITILKYKHVRASSIFGTSGWTRDPQGGGGGGGGGGGEATIQMAGPR